jgi:hypothetical protein
MGLVTDALVDLLQEQMNAHCTLVWYDPGQHYLEVTQSLSSKMLAGAAIHRYERERRFIWLRRELEPFWIYEPSGDTAEGTAFKIERKVPVSPLSREIGRIEQLKRSLVAYRSVIGQPRQQDLLEFLSARLSEQELQEFADSVAIDPSPPRAGSKA